MKSWLSDSKGMDDWREAFSSQDFALLLSDFLFDVEGAEHQQSFKFDSELVCGEPAPPINVSKKNYN